MEEHCVCIQFNRHLLANWKELSFDTSFKLMSICAQLDKMKVDESKWKILSVLNHTPRLNNCTLTWLKTLLDHYYFAILFIIDTTYHLPTGHGLSAPWLTSRMVVPTFYTISQIIPLVKIYLCKWYFHDYECFRGQ